MAEGFFSPDRLRIPGLEADRLRAAMVRILPTTVLVLDMAPDADEARRRARNEALPDGSECWHRFFTAEDIAKADDPEFAMGMVRHEFARAVRAGAVFPVTVPLDGGGSGFAIDANGLVVTNYHLVTAEIANHGRHGGAMRNEVRCRSLRAQVARRGDDGRWAWRDAESLWLVSNPPSARAMRDDANGVTQLREDIALLRVEPPPSACLEFAEKPVATGDRVWMAGFPLRSARGAEALAQLGYADADGSLRVSSWPSKARTTSAPTCTARWATAARRSSIPSVGSSACSRASPATGRATRSRLGTCSGCR
ncbi:MAG: trypsin-like peptidase domain-containing protein [Solirubrobacteraceae bacterium]|nr:trypsin-like peptidase domain-containing protein [Solirubrobacteraceae bacterium]